MSKKTRVLKKSTLFLDKLKNLCYNKKKKEKTTNGKKQRN